MNMKVSKGLGVPVVAMPCVRHMPAKDGDEQESTLVFHVAAKRATRRLVIGMDGAGWFGKRLDST